MLRHRCEQKASGAARALFKWVQIEALKLSLNEPSLCPWLWKLSAATIPSYSIPNAIFEREHRLWGPFKVVIRLFPLWKDWRKGVYKPTLSSHIKLPLKSLRQPSVLPLLNSMSRLMQWFSALVHSHVRRTQWKIPFSMHWPWAFIHSSWHLHLI